MGPQYSSERPWCDGTTQVVSLNECAEGYEFQRIVRASVGECCETWRSQVERGEVNSETLELVVGRAAVPILRLLVDKPPAVMLVLLPSLVRVMLLSFLEVMTSI